MKHVIVLQARTSSSRLPAKVLLPLGGLPLVVLAARRAGNTGGTVLVATSSEASDDGLADTLHRYGVECFRGSLDNTLERVVHACSNYPDDTIVVRLTADNPFPDGALIDQLVDYFVRQKLDYVCCNGQPSGVPYGLSVEVTRLRHLREADSSELAPGDREHVTPSIVRKFGAHYYEAYKSVGMGHFRCTVDTYDDYISMQRLFLSQEDPVGVQAFELVSQLRGLAYQPLGDAVCDRMVVGGAQLGFAYGVANTHGKPSSVIAREILKSAISSGARWIDTANAYGESEAVIGAALGQGWSNRVEVVTKLSPLNDCAPDASSGEVEARVDASVLRSCVQLGRASIDVLMLHRAEHLSSWGGVAWKRLLALREVGRIKHLGVSVQTPNELEIALGFEDVRYIQMPFNMLDWRWACVLDQLNDAREKHGLVIHTRSSLLQGLLPSRDESLWERARVGQPTGVMDWLENQVIATGREDVADLALAYVRAHDWVDGVVVGMETLDQLQANVHCFNKPPLTLGQVLEINASRPRLEVETLDPSRWAAI